MPALARNVDSLEFVLGGIGAEHLNVRGELRAELSVDRVVDLIEEHITRESRS